jgi:acetylornithine deacetylase/succinyl-diaminopimelate desuccinylase-like protein
MKKMILMGCLMPALVFAQSKTALKVRDWRISREASLLNDYRTFLSIPNVAADTSGLMANAEWIRARLKANGVAQTQFLYPTTPGQAPAVYGRVDVPGATRTIALYAHYDGQPVDPSKWASGLKPFTPQLTNGSLLKGASLISWDRAVGPIDPEWRIYARGASDDKAGVYAIIEAYAALSAVGLTPSANLIFFFEGEEEAGSDHLPEIFERHRQLLKADAWVICDGPVHASGLHQLVHGVRGDTHLDLTVYGPKRPLHSGHYGNWIPNPAMELARLLASMKNDKGEVTIKGFYDDVIPLTKAEREAIGRIPPVEDQLKKELGVRKPERDLPLNEAIAMPSMNINGFAAAGVGERSANVIPVKAEASIDLRLVAGNDWKRQQEKVIAHIRTQGFHVTEQEPTDAERATFDRICQVKKSSGYNAQKTPMNDPNALRIGAALDAALETPAIRVPTLGGSLPLFMFEQILNVRPVTVPIANHDNNQHAENENIRIGNLWKGIEIYASIMTGF